MLYFSQIFNHIISFDLYVQTELCAINDFKKGDFKDQRRAIIRILTN